MDEIFKALNDNQGVLTLALFAVSAVYGWASGIFSTLRRKPKLLAEALPGPTFFCVFPTGQKFSGHEAHRIAFALYLSVKNVGSAATTIENVHIGYRWNAIPTNLGWIKFGFIRYWLRNQTTVLSEFQSNIGENIKLYPFLFQKSAFFDERDLYLKEGMTTSGVVYFEQDDSFGSCQPKIKSGFATVTVRIVDVFENKFDFNLKIPKITFEDANKMNPKIGRTFSELRGEKLPFDETRSGETDGSGI